jgi:hypothetical protein
VAIDIDAIEPLEVVVELVEELVELVALVVVVEVEVTVLVVVVVVVEDVDVVPGGLSAATSFEKYEGRVFQGLPPPALVM